MKNCEFAGNRSCRRSNLKISARYFLGNTIVLGNITSITDRCMCISTRYTIPLGSSIHLFIPFRKNVLNIPVTVARYLNRERSDEAMCVEVSNPSTEYLEFFNSIEQRMCVRIPASLEVDVIIQDIKYPAFLKNISEYGLSTILTPMNRSADFVLGTQSAVKFQIPSDEQLNLSCEIRWSSEDSDFIALGMKIINLPANYKEILNTLQ